jgi:hypothetical protein
MTPIVKRLTPGGNRAPGLRRSSKNHGMAQSSQKPPESAMRAEKALVFASELLSECNPLSMPTMIASNIISPAEQTVNETFESRFRDRESSVWCSANVVSPASNARFDSCISGRERASPGKAAVQNVSAPWYVITVKISELIVENYALRLLNSQPSM